jgi:hypothetical protein
MLDHGDDCLIPLVIGKMQLYGLSPHLVLLASSDKFWDMKSARVSSNVVHQSEWEVFSVHDTEVSADTIVSSLVTHSLLEKGDELLIVAELLVMLNKIFQMVWKDNDVQSTFAGSGELLGPDA